MKGKVLLVIAVFLWPFCTMAQDAGKGFLKLTLDEAVEYAVKYNKELQVSRMNIDAYKEKIRESISQGLPQVSVGSTYSTNFGYKMDFAGNPLKLEDQLNASGTISQLIFNGQWIVGIQTARVVKRVAEQQTDITELDIKQNVADSYFAVLVADRSLKILEGNLKNTEEILQHTQHQYNAGTVEITDVNQLRITVGQLKNSVLSMERSRKISHTLLQLQLGLSANSELELTDPLDKFLNPEAYLGLSLLAFNITNNAEYLLQSTQVELQQKQVSLQRWSFAPTISGVYSYDKKIVKPSFSLSPEHAASITLNLPIFTGFQRRAVLAQQKIALDQAQLTKSLLEDQLNLQDEQYRFELENALENYKLQKENVEVALQVLQNFQNKYTYGVISSLDMTNANNNYLQAESAYTSACLTLFQARTQLERLYNTMPW